MQHLAGTHAANMQIQVLKGFLKTFKLDEKIEKDKYYNFSRFVSKSKTDTLLIQKFWMQ